MAGWETRTRTITRREWVVPLKYNSSNDHSELLGAIYAARDVRAANLGVNVGNLSDDALMVSATDDEIVIWFETDEVTDR